MTSSDETTGRVAAALARRGLELPAPLVPNATYVPVARSGSLLFVSGQLPFDADGTVIATGRLGDDVDFELARACAERCALNLLAQLQAAVGDLDRVQLVKVQTFVASTPEFDQHHVVANGASDLLVELLGERGRHARSAFGVAALPFGGPVEVEAVAEELPAA